MVFTLEAADALGIPPRERDEIGGREIHPINVRVGGWYRVPRKRELEPLRASLEHAREIALEAVRFTAGLRFPEYEQPYELVALSQSDEYPIDRGRIVSSNGLDIDVADYDDHFVEEHVPWSNALHSRLRERGSYLCGPLARYALSAERLSEGARGAAGEAGLTPAERPSAGGLGRHGAARGDHASFTGAAPSKREPWVSKKVTLSVPASVALNAKVNDGFSPIEVAVSNSAMSRPR